MKQNFFLLLISFLIAMSARAQVTVCGSYLEESGQVNSPYIKSGTVTWDAASHTLTLDNASIEYTSDNPQDGIRPLRVTGDATIVVHGDCKLTTTGHVAIAIDSYNSKNVTIKGNGTLSTSSSWIDIFLVVAHLTIQDITLNVVKGIANNAEGNGVGLTFDNVQATIMGEVARIGDGITFKDCAITYPEDAYLGQTGYGYIIYYGNGQLPDKIIISRTGSNVKGDVNGDGEVNIADVNAVIKVILDGESNPRADVNNDTEVNIGDMNAIINIILGDAEEGDDKQVLNYIINHRAHRDGVVVFSQNTEKVVFNYTRNTIQITNSYKDIDGQLRTFTTPRMQMAKTSGTIFSFLTTDDLGNGVKNLHGCIDYATGTMKYEFQQDDYLVVCTSHLQFSDVVTTISDDTGVSHENDKSQYTFILDSNAETCTMMIFYFVLDVNGAVQEANVSYNDLKVTVTDEGYIISADQAISNQGTSYDLTDVDIIIDRDCEHFSGSFKTKESRHEFQGNLFE